MTAQTSYLTMTGTRRRLPQWRLIFLLIASNVALFSNLSVLRQLHTSQTIWNGGERAVISYPPWHNQDDSMHPRQPRVAVEETLIFDSTRTSRPAPFSNYAYACLVAGCNHDTPACLGYLYNILNARYILNETGSTADMVVMVRMASDSSSEYLPFDQAKLLNDNGIRITYLPRAAQDNFYSAVMDKFYILNMTEYRRVLYLDSDVIPLCNLDYVFHLSDGDHPVLKENFVITWQNEPAQGGFFMLKPGRGELEELQGIVEAQEAKMQDKNEDWNETIGWGHKIEAPDSWQSLRKANQTCWNFYGAYADQGLLYHWTKYVKKSVSIVIFDTLQTWSATRMDGIDLVHLERTDPGVLDKYTCSEMDLGGAARLRHAPMKDFYHFAGHEKPWTKTYEKLPIDVLDTKSAETPVQLWFHAARNVIARNHLTIDPMNMTDLTVGPLGKTLVRKMKLASIVAKRDKMSDFH